jgi:hypothetical protein
MNENEEDLKVILAFRKDMVKAVSKLKAKHDLCADFYLVKIVMMEMTPDFAPSTDHVILDEISEAMSRCVYCGEKTWNYDKDKDLAICARCDRK